MKDGRKGIDEAANDSPSSQSTSFRDRQRCDSNCDIVIVNDESRWYITAAPAIGTGSRHPERSFRGNENALAS
jgi:hypothetical protein